MVPNVRSVAARAPQTDALLIKVSLAGVLRGFFWRIIWAHVICGLDENVGMDRDTDLIFHAS
jgi:hypothetical protein